MADLKLETELDGTATVFVVTLLLFGGLAQPAGAQLPGENDPDDMEKKIADMQSMLKSRIELLGAKTAAKDAGTDPESGLQRNLLYASSARPPEGELQTIRQCIDPPQDRLGSYSIAIVRFDDPNYISPAEFGGGRPMPDVVLDHDKYLEMMAEHAPAPRQERRPGVRMVFDVGPGDWSYDLGPGWDARSRVRDYLDAKLDREELEIESDDVADAACTVVEHVERFLAKKSGKDASTFFEIRESQRRIADLRRRLDAIDRYDLDGLGGRPDDAALLKPDADKASLRLSGADEALSNANLPEAKRNTEVAAAVVDQLETTYDQLNHHTERSGNATDEVDERDTELGFRAIPLMPGGERLWAQLDTCRERAESYRDAFERGADLAELDEREGAFDRCLEQLDRTAKSSAEDFNFWFYRVLPGALLALAMVVVGRWYANSQRASSTEYQAETAREEWHRRLPAIQDRLDQLDEKYPELLTEAGSRDPTEVLDGTDIERIDLAFALAARAHELLDEADRTLQLEDAPREVRLEEVRRILKEERSD